LQPNWLLRRRVPASSATRAPLLLIFGVVAVQLKGSYEGRVFDEREVSFTLGEEGEGLGIPRGVEEAIRKMKKGERSRITISPKYGWPDGNPTHNIPANATIR